MKKTIGITLFTVACGAMLTSPASAGSIGLVGDDSCLSTNGVFFCDADIQATGTGVFDPFMRVFRDNDTKDGTPSTFSSGWNTNSAALPESNDAPKTWNDALALATLGTLAATDLPGAAVGASGTYYMFTVDINQEGKKPKGEPDVPSYLSLVQFQLFNCATDSYSAIEDCGAPFFSAFSAGDWVDFDYRNHTGSGSGDINVFVPASVLFAGPFLALRDGWGIGGPGGLAGVGQYADNDGYQEWAANLGENATNGGQTTAGGGTGTGPGYVPEPASLVLLGSGLVGAAYRMRRRS